jgi:hypothetical protein
MWGGFLNPRRSHECERGTQKCVRYDFEKIATTGRLRSRFGDAQRLPHVIA